MNALNLEDLDKVSGGQFDESYTVMVTLQKDIKVYRAMGLDRDVIWNYKAGDTIAVYPDSWTILYDYKWIYVDTPNGFGATPAEDIPGNFSKC